MVYNRAGMSEWYWGGGPNRRLLVGLLATLVGLGIPYLAGSPSSIGLITWFVGWQFGAWFMDKVYIERQSRQRVTPR